MKKPDDNFVFLRELVIWAEISAGKYHAIADVIRSGEFSRLSAPTWAKVADALEKHSKGKKKGAPKLKAPEESKTAPRDMIIAEAFREGRAAGIPYNDVLKALARIFHIGESAIEKATVRGEALLKGANQQPE